MIQQIKSVEALTTLHWFLAYGGLLVHILLKLKETKGPLVNAINRKEVLTAISSAVLVPIILIICTDKGMSEILPINYVSAFLAGYQTQSFARTFSKFVNRERVYRRR